MGETMGTSVMFAGICTKGQTRAQGKYMPRHVPALSARAKAAIVLTHEPIFLL